MEQFMHIATYCIAETALLLTLIKVMDDRDIPGALSLILSISLGIGSFLCGLKIIVLIKEYGVFSLPHMKLINILIFSSAAVIVIIRFIILIMHWRQLKR